MTTELLVPNSQTRLYRSFLFRGVFPRRCLKLSDCCLGCLWLVDRHLPTTFLLPHPPTWTGEAFTEGVKSDNHHILVFLRVLFKNGNAECR